ncbi:hypothetical protein K443DRAFT_12578 [Laccaria amethystina LaAM-08-1]|uniref:Uncharacterized protein n=1 Tax=Laccaria amethystina LaAM-08-1 TaxID=1095629 RepID=A0A0C9WR54_9AGAR|nr:hypothetical protein K443DRAFT_12578 [Laccaria amethystina LaAM-08-1]
MTVNKTARVQHDTPTKNRFIGAMEATGKLRQSAAKYGIKPSTASGIWTKYKDTGTTKNRPRSGRPPKLTDQPVWHELKKIIQPLPHPPTSVPKLIKAVQDAWDALEIPDIDKYVDTMSERVQAVLDANGGHTRF